MGIRPVRMPITMPDEIAATTDTVSSAPATPVDSPCATVRYGTPHISANTVTENCVPMWVKKPNRVPAAPHRLDAGQRRADRLVSRRRPPAARGVLDHREREHHRQRSERRDRHVRGRPARVR